MSASLDTKSSSGVGILGLGLYLPTTVRDNSWWPGEIIARWRERAIARPPMDPTALSEDERLVVAAMAQYQADPFQGARLRHVVADDQSAVEVEVMAAREAIAAAGVPISEIDLLLTHSAVADYLCTNTACSVHERLGLPSACFTLSVEAASNAFLMQAALADQAIRQGRARYALLVQSCTLSRILPQDAEYSAWLGDAATAVLVGPVPAGQGFITWQHRTDGSLENTFVAGIPGKRWYDEGRVIGYPADPAAARRMFLSLVTSAKDACSTALAEAGLTAADVKFYASHQGTSWFRAVTQQALQLSNARFVDSFATTGSVYSANVPLCLYSGQREGLLSPDDIVLMFSGGGGTTYTCGIMKWSR